jgi:hypothetical protein
MSSSSEGGAHPELSSVEDRHSEFNLAQLCPPPPQPGAFHVTAEQYRLLYARSIEDPDGFWAEQARSTLHWFRDFREVRGGSFIDGDVRWFSEGQLNVCYQCVDRACGCWEGVPAALAFAAPPPFFFSSFAPLELLICLPLTHYPIPFLPQPQRPRAHARRPDGHYFRGG